MAPVSTNTATAVPARNPATSSFASEPIAQSRSVIVLGMHRSGTSAVTGSLEQAGLFLGDVGTEAPDNRKGNREPPLINVLHEELLAANGGAWDRPVAPLRWGRLHRACRDLFIAQFEQQRIWGFKDPRTVLGLAEWLAVLPQADLVGVFRHPDDVARSLQSRNDLQPEQGWELWTFYNRTLLWWSEQRPDLRLIEFDAVPSTTAANLAKLIVELGLPGAPDNQAPFYDPSLASKSALGSAPVSGPDRSISDADQSSARTQALDIYRRLRDRMEDQSPDRRRQPSCSPPRFPSEPSPPSTPEVDNP